MISLCVTQTCVSDSKCRPHCGSGRPANPTCSATVDQMVARMRQGAFFGTSAVRKGALPGNPVFFYTNLPGTPQQQVGWGRIWSSTFIRAMGGGATANSYDSFNAVSTSWLEAQLDLLVQNPRLWYPGDTPRATRTLKAWSDCYCQALAAAAQAPYALLGIPDGATWRADS